MNIVEMEENKVKVKQEQEDVVDPTTTCCANEAEGCCSQDLVDLNSLTQILDLVSMEPRVAGELTAAEKYIIKSRLKIEFWRAEEKPSFICTGHRQSIVHGLGHLNQACSVCAKKRSKKLDMYYITYRMAVEFYMTEGRFLSIGLLACSSCRTKSLKGLDFSNSYLVPDSGHPLDQKDNEQTEEKKAEKREVILQPLVIQGKLATIQPLPPRPTQAQVPPAASHSPALDAETEVKKWNIQRLMESLTACNPSYKPPGFTINNLEECSQGVLQDAIQATQTAVTTLLSAIAPGQEASLWRKVKPALDLGLLDKEASSPMDL